MSHRKLIKLFPRLKLSPTHHLMMMFSGLRLVQWSLSGAQRALLVPVCCWYGAGPVWTASGHLGLLPSLPGPQRLPQNWWWEERGFSGPNITFKKLVQIIWRMADFISKSETRSLHKLSDMLIWWSPPLHNQYTRVLRRRDGRSRGKYLVNLFVLRYIVPSLSRYKNFTGYVRPCQGRPRYRDHSPILTAGKTVAFFRSCLWSLNYNYPTWT